MSRCWCYIQHIRIFKYMMFIALHFITATVICFLKHLFSLIFNLHKNLWDFGYTF